MRPESYERKHKITKKNIIMKHKNKLLTLFLPLLLASCAEDFLDMKRDKKQVIPTTIAQQQALLDNTNEMNLTGSLVLNVIGGEEYTVTQSVWELLPATEDRNAYIWAADVFEGGESEDWNNAYKRVLYANTALDGISKFQPSAIERVAWENVKGSALFIRSLSFYQLLQSFCKPYDANNSKIDPGIPLRLEADITLPVSRASVEEGYLQVISDLKVAAQLLPQTAVHKVRPSRAAAYALLAKTLLHTGDYTSAKKYADSCILISGGLLDYNTLDPSLRYVFSGMRYGEGNPEVLYHQTMIGHTVVNATRFILYKDLYDLYESGDIRKSAFFFLTAGNYSFKGSYSGAYAFFSGLALDEIYLLRAECHARLGQLDAGLEDLNALRRKRYRPSGFTLYTTADQQVLLKKIVEERRKQLLCRGVRWEDLRRLNRETIHAVVLERNLNGQSYRLEPGSRRYVWPIPDNVIKASGIEQNSR